MIAHVSDLFWLISHTVGICRSDGEKIDHHYMADHHSNQQELDKCLNKSNCKHLWSLWSAIRVEIVNCVKQQIIDVHRGLFN